MTLTSDMKGLFALARPALTFSTALAAQPDPPPDAVESAPEGWDPAGSTTAVPSAAGR